MSAPLRFVSWAAVSSLPQTKKVSLEDQLKTNREHVERHNGRLVAELVVPGESRSIVLFEEACRRIEAYAKLKEMIDARSFDVLVYLDRSRLGRKASLSMAIVELCHEAGIVTYETENPPLVLQPGNHTSHDEMLIGAIKSVGAQREIVKLQERHQMGMIDRVKRGEFPGRIPFGWRVVYAPDGTRMIQVDEEAAQLIRLVFVDLYLTRGLGRPKIAEILNEKGYRTPHGSLWAKDHLQAIFSRVLRYAGYAEINLRGNRPYVRAPGNWPAILSLEEAQAVITEKEQRARARRSVSKTYLFSLCVWCATCGRRMVMTTSFQGKHKQRRRLALRCVGHDIHHNHRVISERKVYAAVRKAIEYLETEENRRQILVEDEVSGVEQTESEIVAARHRLQELQNALYRVDDAYVLGRMDGARYQRQVERLTSQIRHSEQSILDLQEQLEQVRHESQRSQRLEEIGRIGLAMLESSDIKAANAWLRRHIKVWVKDCEVFRIDYL